LVDKLYQNLYGRNKENADTSAPAQRKPNFLERKRFVDYGGDNAEESEKNKYEYDSEEEVVKEEDLRTGMGSKPNN
jgi:hypothetical protein